MNAGRSIVVGVLMAAVAAEAVAHGVEPVQVEAGSTDPVLERAMALQHRHRFAEAEQLLSGLLERNPRDREARLARAQIRLHRHRAPEALADCIELAPLVDALTAATCVSQARAALGEPSRAYALVTAALRNATGSAAVRSWSAGVAGDLAAELGDFDTAGAWFREALSLNPDDHYLRMRYDQWRERQSASERALPPQ